MRILLFLVPCTAFVPLQSVSRPKTPLYGDGNPPPFGNWAVPAPAAAPAPAADPYANWGQPAASPVVAPQTQEPVMTSVQPPMQPSAAGGNDAIATLQASQDAVVASIQASMALTPKPELSLSNEPLSSGATVTLQAWDAPGAPNVAWLASTYLPQQVSSLTIFNGPLTDVPHILSRCVNTGNALELAVDVRPRAYGAYEMVDAQGNYPGPEELGRQAFEYSGARNDFFGKFGTDALKSAMDPAQFEGATPLSPSELDLKTGGPLGLYLSMPNTPANIQAIANVRQAVANAWLTWAQETDHNHRPGAPVNTQYVYDSKFRQECYSALLPYYSQQLGGADGAKLAAAESGPLDEGYVGGGS